MGNQINRQRYPVGAIMLSPVCKANTNIYGPWRSLVAHSLGVGEVAGSNPVGPILICNL